MAVSLCLALAVALAGLRGSAAAEVPGAEVQAAGGRPVVRLTSLSWPPYNGPYLPGGGATTQIARRAFAVEGYTLEVDFLPWNRAVAVGLSGQGGQIGYFPEYWSDAYAKTRCDFSTPIGYGPLGFIEPMDKPITWKTLDDLAGYRIGTVIGYVNTEAFDRRAAAGRLKVEKVVSDALNVNKVARRRLDLAVIDPNVFRYIVRNELPSIRGLVRFNRHILEEKGLYVCFARRPGRHGEDWRAIFDRGLAKLNVRALQAQFLREMGVGSGE